MSKYATQTKPIAPSVQPLDLKAYARGRVACRVLEGGTFLCFLAFVFSIVGVAAADFVRIVPPTLVGQLGDLWRIPATALLVTGLLWSYLEADYGLVDQHQERRLWALRQLMPQVDVVLAEIAKQNRAVTRKEYAQLIDRYYHRAAKHALARHYKESLA